MSTLLIFFITIAQIVAVAVSYLMPIPALFDALVVYGSPPYFIMNLLSENSVALDSYPLFPVIALYHVIKYILLCRSQFGEQQHSLHYVAVILECSYLVICGFNL